MENKVSVIIPTYNREKTIEYCINSVLSQTIKPYEIIVVDDCSNDRTVEIIKNLNINIIKVFKLDKNSGAQAARNKGIKEATGNWIAFQDSDDEWIETRIEKCLNKAINENFDIVYSECIINNHVENKTYKMGIRNFEIDTHYKLLKNSGPMFQSILVKKECFEKAGLLDENVPAYQEWDTSIYLSKYYNFGFIKEPLFIYHLHEGETISKNPYRDAAGWAYVVDKYYNEIKQKLGLEVLINHYNNIVNKFEKINDADSCLKYEKKLIDLKYEGRKIYNQYYNDILTKDNQQLIERYKSYYLMYNKWVSNLHYKKYLGDYISKNNYKSISIYGIGEVAIRLYEEIKGYEVIIECFIVKSKDTVDFIDGIPVIELDNISNIKSELILVTPIYDFENIKKDLLNYKICTNIISLEQIVNHMQ